jgi:ribosomal protein L11 methyltransferase
LTPRRSPGREAQGGWAEVRVVTSSDAAEAVAAILWGLGVAGVVETRGALDTVVLRCYLPAARARPSSLRRLRQRVRGLRRHGLQPGRSAVTARSVPAVRWARAARRAVRPFHLGRLTVAPTWARVAARPGRIVLRIDPGMAFGSGAHPSTRLCLRALLHCLPAYRCRAVIDVGTGSGILAIAAARLGASRVWARDVDPVAVSVARENVRANDVVRTIRLVRGRGLGPTPLRAGMIVANLIAETVAALLPAVRSRLEAGGMFVGSGIVADRLPEVLAAAGANGLSVLEVLTSAEWRAVILTAKPGAAAAEHSSLVIPRKPATI